MTRGFSLYLDVVRILAALAVLFGHIAHTRFTGGDLAILRDINLASDAVVVFFVISGVVIAYAAERDGTINRFAFNRVTRLISVILPAIVLTLLFDMLGTRTDPSAYPAPYYVETSVADHLMRGLSFSVEWTGTFERVRLGTNGPLWSLSYEAAYYILFACAVFLSGPLRIICVAVAIFIFGLPIMLLLPCWLLGVFVWRLVRQNAQDRLSLPNAFALTITPMILLPLFKSLGLDDILQQVTENALLPASHHAVLGYSDEVLWNTLFAVGVAAHLIGVAKLASMLPIASEGDTSARLIRWVAGASFSLYVTHYPTLHLLDAVLPEQMPLHDLAMFVVTLAVAFAFAQVFERPLGPIRRKISDGLDVVAARRRARA